jgi:hypothetical protein
MGIACGLLGPRATPGLLEGAGRLERLGWVIGGCAGVALFMVVRGFLPSSWMGELIVAGVVALLLVIGGGAATLVRPTDPAGGRPPSAR